MEYNEKIEKVKSADEVKANEIRLNLEKVMREKGAVEIYKKIEGFTDAIQTKYPNCRDYVLFHVVSGSTPPDSCNKFDFYGEDSVEKFIESL